jgi:hypothetical protein
MRWYLRHWYDVGLLVAILALATGLIVDLNRLQQILLLGFAILLLHQFEELGWPGGFPTFFNVVMLNRGGDPSRYPLNQLNNMVVNVPAAYPFFLLPIFYPKTIWLALGPVLFGFFEVLIHAVAPVVRARARYNPGLLTVFPWLALSVWYIVEASDQALITTSDWWIGAGYALAWVAIFLVFLTQVVLSDPNSPHPFDEVEMSRFDKYAHLVHAAVHPTHAPTPHAPASS